MTDLLDALRVKEFERAVVCARFAHFKWTVAPPRRVYAEGGVAGGLRKPAPVISNPDDTAILG
jgi:hypothetical protein